MDELSMLRGLRRQDAYPDEPRKVARDRLLAEATAPAAIGRRAPSGTRAARRISWRWQAGMAAALAGAAALAVTGTYLTGGAHAHGVANGAQAPGTSAGSVLLLAADAA